MPYANNSVVLSGRLTRDPRVTDQVCAFTLAVDRAGRTSQEAGFFNTVVFSGQTRLYEWAKDNVKKGYQVNVIGRLRHTTKGEGEDRQTFWDIVAEDIQFLSAPKGSKSSNGNGAAEESNNSDEPSVQELEELGI